MSEENLNPEMQAAGQAPIPVDEVSELKSELESCQAELQEARDQVLRAHAEMQNLRRRTEADLEKAHKFALDKFAQALLPVVDNLERALEAAGAEGAELPALLEGVDLTYRSFIDTLAKFQLEQINPVGETFNPELHEAISAVPAPGAAPNSVLNVVQKGYALNGRVVRAALVVVARAE